MLLLTLTRVRGKKAGVYQETDGTCHSVRPRCSHMGCQLEWNPDEHTWDCPCHGSRYDPDGVRLNGPAQSDLKKP